MHVYIEDIGRHVGETVTLKGWLHNRIEGPHRPKDLVVVETLPRTATGKIDRERLRSALGERTV